MQQFEVQVACTVCGQSLMLPATDLNASFMCPRCGTTQTAKELVPTSTPVRAIPNQQPGAVVMRLGSTELLPGTPAPLTGALSTQANVTAPRSPEQYRPLRDQTQQATSDPIAAKADGYKRSAVAATTVAVALGNAAAWLDRVASGKRLAFLAGLGFAVWFAREHFGGTGYVLSLFVYTSLLYLLLLARFWWVRDQDGNWTWRTFNTRARVAVADSWESVFSAQERSWAGTLEQFRSLLLALGIGLVVLGSPAGAIVGALLSLLGLEQQRADFASFVEMLSSLGTAMVVLALLTWFLRKAQRRTPQADSFRQAAIALRNNRQVPFVLDTFEGVAGGAPAELGILVEHLARWKPRHLDSEAAYEASLKRFLQRELPGTKIERQHWLQDADGRRVGKLDLVVDDVLAIEMKRLLRSSEADRAVGQVWKYAEAWTQGPVLLLLCETHANFAQAAFVHRVGQLRESGHPLFIVAAGRRLG